MGRTFLNIGLWLAQLYLAFTFFTAGFSKLSGDPGAVGLFQTLGGDWFRYLTGGLEVLAAILLVIPMTAAFGATIGAVVMIGAIITHVAVLGNAFLMPLILLGLCLFVIWGRRHNYSRFKRRDIHITKRTDAGVGI